MLLFFCLSNNNEPPVVTLQLQTYIGGTEMHVLLGKCNLRLNSLTADSRGKNRSGVVSI